jgi:hypothetical protein
LESVEFGRVIGRQFVRYYDIPDGWAGAVPHRSRGPVDMEMSKWEEKESSELFLPRVKAAEPVKGGASGFQRWAVLWAKADEHPK